MRKIKTSLESFFFGYPTIKLHILHYYKKSRAWCALTGGRVESVASVKYEAKTKSNYWYNI